MKNHYLIEFRFQSKKAKEYLRGMIHEVNQRFKVGKKKHVPHITLVGPIQTNNEKKLISDFSRICASAPLMKFKVNGFGTFDNTRVVYVDIIANEHLNSFRLELVNSLQHYCHLQPHDTRSSKEQFGYHSTLAMKLSPTDYQSIKKYISQKPRPQFGQVVMRVTLLKGGKILREYDFMQRRMLHRREALDKRTYRQSIELLKRFMAGQYHPQGGIRTAEVGSKSTPKHKSHGMWKGLLRWLGISSNSC